MASVTPIPSLVTKLRGSVPESPPDARAIMRLSKNPRCDRLAAITMAHTTPAMILQEVFGETPKEAQSPFAIAKGKRFEREQTDRDALRLITTLLAECILGPNDVSVLNIELETLTIKDAKAKKDRQVEMTDEILRWKATGDPRAPALVIQAAIKVRLGAAGTVVLRPDLLIARADESVYRPGELKSYAYLHHLTDEKDVGQACGQLGVYGVALEDRLKYLGLPSAIADTGIIAMLKPGSMDSVARTQNIVRDISTVRRIIAVRSQILTDTIHLLGEGNALDVEKNILKLTPCYGGQCRNFCALHRKCREEATRQSNPALLGEEVEAMLTPAHCTIKRASELCAGSPPVTPDERMLQDRLLAAQQQWRFVQ